MLGKLLKYDLKWVYKFIVVFYILALVFSLFSRIFSSIDNSLLFSILSGICNGFAIGMLISSLINTLMRSWTRFIRNIYKDESYLTHTLPVSKNNIYLSKVLTAIIALFTTTMVILICLFICYYSKENIEVLKNILELTASTYNTTVIKLILIFAIIFFLELIFIMLVGYTGIIIGHKSNSNKIIKSIIWSFCMYIGTQAITLGLVFIMGLFNKDIMNIINTTNIVNINGIKYILVGGILIYIVYNIIYYFIGKYQLEKGVNVD